MTRAGTLIEGLFQIEEIDLYSYNKTSDYRQNFDNYLQLRF